MSDYRTGRCVIGSKEHSADVGYLCANHLQRLGAMLRDIEDEAAILSAVPSMQQRMGSGKGGLASECAPARLDVLVHTDRRRGTGKSETDDDALAAGETLPILDVLHSWARLVREERGLTLDGFVTISSERHLLTRHLDFAVAQPWADEFYGDISALVGQLKAVNGHRPDRPFSKCPAIVGGDYCIGHVWIRDELQPVWRLYPDRCAKAWEHAPGAAVCDTCGSEWVTDAEKARLKRMADDMARDLARPRTADGRDMMTAEEIAKQLGKTVNAVRIMATRAGVKALDGHFDPQLFGLACHVA